jgi:7-cyano-7-deazaguanine synthase
LSGALVLLSGGMDSAVCLYRAAADVGAHQVTTVFFDWKQRTLAEERLAAVRLCEAAGVRAPVAVKLDFPYGGILTEAQAEVPRDRTPEEIEAAGVALTFFPGRNPVMLAYAFGIATSLGLDTVYFGPNAQDAAGYPDCREEFLRAMESACRMGVDRRISLTVPLIAMSKADIVRDGDSLGVPWELTFSCYSPSDGRECGRCDACVLKREALSR